MACTYAGEKGQVHIQEAFGSKLTLALLRQSDLEIHLSIKTIIVFIAIIAI